VFVGCVAGVLLGCIESVILVNYFNYPTFGKPGPLLKMALIFYIAPIYQIGYAAIPEETLFRGFLWGALRKIRINDFWILLFQAALFTAGHIHLLNIPNPMLNLSLIFIGTIIFGLLAWRSRSIAASMMAHAFFNGSAIFSIYLIWFLFQR
jgi:membrane protease YdiL (CAAX protease family)